MYVYMDLVVVLNVLVDLLLLLGANRMTGYPTRWKRVIPAALLGGVYAGTCLLPGFRFLGNALWRLVFLALMAVTAFGVDVGALKRCCAYLLLSMALGGIAGNMSRGDRLGFPIAAALLCFLWNGIGSIPGGSEYVPMEIRNGDQILRLTALRDTGNTLRDPLTGEQIQIIDSEAAQALTGLTQEDLSRPLDSIGKHPGLRLIPYRTVGQSSGMLLAKRFDSVRIGKWKGSAVIAFAPQKIGSGEGCRALTGGAIG